MRRFQMRKHWESETFWPCEVILHEEKNTATQKILRMTEARTSTGLLTWSDISARHMETTSVLVSQLTPRDMPKRAILSGKAWSMIFLTLCKRCRLVPTSSKPSFSSTLKHTSTSRPLYENTPAVPLRAFPLFQDLCPSRATR